MRFLDTLRQRYVASDDAVEADELRSRTADLGMMCIADVADRSRVDVYGVVRHVTLPAAGEKVVTFTASLYDGTAAVELVWLGRQEVPGITPGTHLRVQGRIMRCDTGRRIFNPRYEILPTHSA